MYQCCELLPVTSTYYPFIAPISFINNSNQLFPLSFALTENVLSTNHSLSMRIVKVVSFWWWGAQRFSIISNERRGQTRRLMRIMTSDLVLLVKRKLKEECQNVRTDIHCKKPRTVKLRSLT